VLRERARLARELHDSVSQALFSMRLHARPAQLAMDKQGLPGDGPLGRSLAQLRELTQSAVAEMRALIFELRADALAEEGIVAALGKQAAALSARSGLPVAVDGPRERLSVNSEVEEHLYRIVLEALNNTVKHAHATEARVQLVAADGRLTVTISDDSIGFDLAQPHPGHLGLSTMRERADVLGAELTVSAAGEEGTTVTVTLDASVPAPPDRVE
jgi:signal transduction histidine kinase